MSSAMLDPLVSSISIFLINFLGINSSLSDYPKGFLRGNQFESLRMPIFVFVLRVVNQAHTLLSAGSSFSFNSLMDHSAHFCEDTCQTVSLQLA